MNTRSLPSRLFFVSALALAPFAASGCLTAAAAGAGTIAGIEYTDRGAKGDLKGSVEEVAHHADTVFRDSGIRTTETKSEKGGTERVLGGKRGDLDVKVTMKATADNITHVEVIAQKNIVQWNKDYSRQILEKIAKRS